MWTAMQMWKHCCDMLFQWRFVLVVCCTCGELLPHCEKSMLREDSEVWEHSLGATAAVITLRHDRQRSLRNVSSHSCFSWNHNFVYWLWKLQSLLSEEYRKQDYLILSDCGEFFNERLLSPLGFLFFLFYDFRELIFLSHWCQHNDGSMAVMILH